MKDVRPSLLIRMPNWVGDVVMALPTLEALQQSGFELQLVGKPWMKVLLEAMNLPIFSLSGNFWQTRKEIMSINTTNKALLLTNSFSSALMTFLAGFETIG
jgi:heptosyltransferase-2